MGGAIAVLSADDVEPTGGRFFSSGIFVCTPAKRTLRRRRDPEKELVRQQDEMVRHVEFGTQVFSGLDT